MTYDERVAATTQHMDNPQVGDRFTEMYAFWVHVVKVSSYVLVEEYRPPCEVPRDAKPRLFADVDAFKAAYSYGHAQGGYWVLYVDARGMEGRA